MKGAFVRLKLRLAPPFYHSPPWRPSAFTELKAMQDSHRIDAATSESTGGAVESSGSTKSIRCRGTSPFQSGGPTQSFRPQAIVGDRVAE